MANVARNFEEDFCPNFRTNDAANLGASTYANMSRSDGGRP